ncbi:MAG: hypothetical protein HUJ42_02425, partial [Malacoplasma sp.]|nr:hypothetical protein [Malacoplasma sp.]
MQKQKTLTNLSLIEIENQLINKIKSIKNKIRFYNKQRAKTNLLYEKKELTTKIEYLEYKLKDIENILVTKLHSNKVINAIICAKEKDVKEIEFILNNQKLSEKDYMHLLSKKMELIVCISKAIKNLNNNFSQQKYPEKLNVHPSVLNHTSNASKPQTIVEKPIEVIKKVPIEVIKEVPVYRDVEIEVIKEVPVEVVKEVPIEVI